MMAKPSDKVTPAGGPPAEEGTELKVGSAVDVWAKKGVIRKLFAPTLSEPEFLFFIGLGKSMGANPFKREIWAIKYDKDKPASVFLARDFYRKVAQRQHDYRGHGVMAVFENDHFLFDIQKGIPEHTFKHTDRGKLIAAYCMAWKDGVERPIFVYVTLEECTKNQSTWKTQPVTQLEKVAEARCLRMAWQEHYAGTYSEDEAPIIEASVKIDKEDKVLSTTAPVRKTEISEIPEHKTTKTEAAEEKKEPQPVEEPTKPKPLEPGKYALKLWNGCLAQAGVKPGQEPTKEEIESAKYMMEALTEYTNKAGKFIRGIREPHLLNESRAQVGYGKLRKAETTGENVAEKEEDPDVGEGKPYDDGDFELTQPEPGDE